MCRARDMGNDTSKTKMATGAWRAMLKLEARALPIGWTLRDRHSACCPDTLPRPPQLAVAAIVSIWPTSEGPTRCCVCPFAILTCACLHRRLRPTTRHQFMSAVQHHAYALRTSLPRRVASAVRQLLTRVRAGSRLTSIRCACTPAVSTALYSRSLRPCTT
jgi:hypothetical protein